MSRFFNYIWFLTTQDSPVDTKFSYFFSLISLVVFGILLLIFISLHIWWTRYHLNRKHLESVNNNSIFHFLKVNVFAIFATIWAAAVVSALCVFIS